MKSGKSLVECQDIERPTYDEIDTPDLEHFMQPNQLGTECRELGTGSVVDSDFDEITVENFKSKLLKILRRKQELEDAVKVKDTAIRKLQVRNAELENELKRKEAVRLSQLELLALRNVELERELHEGSKP